VLLAGSQIKSGREFKNVEKGRYGEMVEGRWLREEGNVN